MQKKCPFRSQACASPPRASLTFNQGRFDRKPRQLEASPMEDENMLSERVRVISIFHLRMFFARARTVGEVFPKGVILFSYQLKHTALVRPTSTSSTTSERSCFAWNCTSWLPQLANHSPPSWLDTTYNIRQFLCIDLCITFKFLFFLPSNLNRSLLTLPSAVVRVSP